MKDNTIFVTPERIFRVASALSSELRVRILTLLYGNRMNINRIAEELGIPQSTCATNVLILEREGLIQTEQVAAVKGAQKICWTTCEDILINLIPEKTRFVNSVIETQMPVGLYTKFTVSRPCGLLSSHGVIGYFDSIDSFLDPHRATAQLVWFAKGFVEYSFPKNIPAGRSIKSVSVTMEVCSEFPGSNPEWPSDITVWVNGMEIGTWTSPGDMGDARGLLTPEWWSVGDSQYGFLKTWKITDERSFVDGIPASDVTLADLGLETNAHFTVRIGVRDDAEYQGGVNLFGHDFGNYDKDIVLQVELNK